MDTTRHVWEGWTVQDFIDDLDPIFDMIMRNQSHVKAFNNKKEIRNWCKNKQPYYGKHIPEVANYFIKKAGL